jgi:hypothetical protein
VSDRAHLPSLDCDHIERAPIQCEDLDLVSCAIFIDMDNSPDIARSDMVFWKVYSEDHTPMFGYH